MSSHADNDTGPRNLSRDSVALVAVIAAVGATDNEIDPVLGMLRGATIPGHPNGPGGALTAAARAALNEHRSHRHEHANTVHTDAVEHGRATGHQISPGPELRDWRCTVCDARGAFSGS